MNAGNLIRAMVLLAPWLTGAPVFSMTVEVVENRIFATGPVGDDWVQFREAFERPGTDTVVFVNSPGGDVWNAIRIGDEIQRRGLKTVAAGYCISACSIMFMAGRERRFSDAYRPAQTYVGIHGAHVKESRQINPALQQRLYAWFRQTMGDKFNDAVISQALYQMEDSYALLRVFESSRNPKAVIYHCPAGYTPREQCTEFKAVSALSLGVITHTDLVRLVIPERFRSRASVLGTELTAVIDNLDEFVSDLAVRRCNNQTCRNGYRNWLTAPENKAIAIRTDRPGSAYVWNRDSPTAALLSAVYTCNHINGAPVALCEAQLVNGYEVRHLYEESAEGHKMALEKLRPPTGKTYGDEEYGAASGTLSTFRTSTQPASTPAQIEGVRTIATQELAMLLKSDAPPVVIDVGGGLGEVLPGSASLVNGGNAYTDAARETAYNGRFVALLALLAPDKNKPVVFYSRDRHSWVSVNAALRASKAGYQSVMWYRGGFSSWREAGLPLAPIAVRAVVN